MSCVCWVDFHSCNYLGVFCNNNEWGGERICTNSKWKVRKIREQGEEGERKGKHTWEGKQVIEQTKGYPYLVEAN